MQDYEKPESTLQDVRKEIDRIDTEMRDLFLRRMEKVLEVARIKAGSGDSIRQPNREAEMLERLTKDMDPEYIEEYTAFLKGILAISRDYQKKKREEMGK